jgi:two-component system, cell cycle sensor histidine kinase and response regulator CckA
LKSVSNGRRLCSLLALLIVSVVVAPFTKYLSTSAQLVGVLFSSPSPSGLTADLPGNIPELRFCVQEHLSSGPVFISLLQLILIVLIFIVGRRHRRDTQSLFAKAFRSSPLPITISTLEEGHLLNVNDAFVEMLGYTRKDVIGRTAAELNIWADKEDRLRLFQTLQHSTSVPTFETKFKTSIGEVREISVSAERIELDGTACVLAITQDITEAKRLENQLRHAQRMSAFGRMAGGVAHDFNNILTVIIGYSELAAHRIGTIHDISKYLLEIKRAGERAAALTRQLLAFSRQQVLYPRVLDLNAVLNNLTQMLLRLIGEDISLSFKPSVPLGHIKADPGQIEQILMSLVVNARDAMPNGGTIAIATSSVTLDEGYLDSHWSVRPGQYVTLSVRDTGCGMDEKTVSHIFEPFFTTKMPGQGTGLGLSTVYGIVKQSDGYLWVYSEPGKGATFKIYFPQSDPDSEKTEKAVPAAESQGGSETILVVEDDASLRKLTTSVLGSMGYKVLEASDAESALTLASDLNVHIDLLLTDVLMPKMSGVELSIELQKLRTKLKVLLMSGYTGNLIAEHRSTEPEMDLIEKPFTRHRLLSKIREALNPD